MRYIKPDYYDSFCCTADKCPDTCCAGWQIVIDEQSLARYESEQGSFAARLQNSIDWDEGVFYQYDRRCAFLNEENLCDLYTELGGQALCDTCRNYPRHTEEFEGLRELSLSLSCPIAADMILRAGKNSAYIEYETEQVEELEEEFEDFDLLLFTQLEDARKIVFAFLRENRLSLTQRIRLALSLAGEMDDCMEEEQFDKMDEVVRNYEKLLLNPEEAVNHAEKIAVRNWETGSRFERMRRNFAVLDRMELLRQEWQEKKDSVYRTLYEKGEKEYDRIVARFTKEVLEQEADGVSMLQAAQNLMVNFVYLWFCGAVYDQWIYSKMAAAVFCTEYILEFVMAQWVQQREMIHFSDVVENAYRLTREIEHSDLNLNALEEWFR